MLITIWLVLVGSLLVYTRFFGQRNPLDVVLPRKSKVVTGEILSQQPAVFYAKEEVAELVKQTQATNALPPQYAISKQLISYSSQDTESQKLTVYGRVYLPQELPSGRKVPAVAFAPGTTGMGDQCAASIEDPAKANWGRYDSHMAAYAAQGYAVIITDYEGMRDSQRLHHYLVGELEGRALLDSLRAIQNLVSAKFTVDSQNLFLAGYSQGGHAALWADKLAPSYASELKIKGVVGFGPVTDVSQTLRDVTRRANINWLGPFLMVSYGDHYKTAHPIERMLLPKWQPRLTADVTEHCIDSLSNFWGRTPEQVYTPEFIQALKSNSLATAGYARLAEQMTRNLVGDQKTKTAKLINHGSSDDVVMADQSRLLLNRLCQAGGDGATSLKIYPGATHYNTMTLAFRDVLTWLKQLSGGQRVKTDCPA